MLNLIFYNGLEWKNNFFASFSRCNHALTCLSCRYCCFASWSENAKYWELLFNFNLTSMISRSKRGLQIICLRGFSSISPREALAQCLVLCPRYATLKLDTRVCAFHCHLPVFPGAHLDEWGLLRSSIYKHYAIDIANPYSMQRLRSPWSLCDSVVEHRRAESEGLRLDSSWGLRSFLCPTLVTRLKSSSFLNRDQNLPSLLFLPNCLFIKLQLFVSAYMKALWIHSKNCCKFITHTYACIGSPERN